MCSNVCIKLFLFLVYSKIIYNDLQSITPEQYYKEIHNRRIAEIHAVSVSKITVISIKVLNYFTIIPESIR